MDPSSLKPWPSDCVQIVAATYKTVNLAGIRGRVSRRVCKDCQCFIGVDSYTIHIALMMPQRDGRPLKFVCVDCCLLYDRSGIVVLIDHRQQSDSGTANEGVLLDE